MANSYIINAIIFLFGTLVTFYTYLLVCRFLLQLLKVNFFNPISQSIVRITDPPLRIIRLAIPGTKRYDFSALVLVFILQLLYIALIPLFLQQNINFLGIFFIAFANTLNKILNFLTFTILAYVIMSWLSHGRYNPLLDIIDSISSPVLAKTRKILPPMAGLDFSPMLTIILLQLFVMLVIIPLRDFGRFSL